ncbi:HAD-IA family hydrolase [Nocardioidaceae bacterium]|nr:HAD-IA family hydrolase [Nocardioidaceae bacterium]
MASDPSAAEPALDWDRVDAVLFDLDGVITPTAEVHMRAWADLFSSVLDGREGVEPYSDADYFEHVDGKPRYDGVRDMLASRGIELPEGTDDDPGDQPAGEETVKGLGNRKDAAFAAALERDGVDPYPGSLALVEWLADRGTAMAIVSSSRNAPKVLAAADVERFFPVVIHGGVASERGIAGKPAPDTYQAAAADLGVAEQRCVVVEDATSGVAAGAAGDFAYVVGVDRGAGEQTLRAHGAEVVVTDLAQLADLEGADR